MSISVVIHVAAIRDQHAHKLVGRETTQRVVLTRPLGARGPLLGEATLSHHASHVRPIGTSSSSSSSTTVDASVDATFNHALNLYHQNINCSLSLSLTLSHFSFTSSCRFRNLKKQKQKEKKRKWWLQIINNVEVSCCYPTRFITCWSMSVHKPLRSRPLRVQNVSSSPQ